MVVFLLEPIYLTLCPGNLPMIYYLIESREFRTFILFVFLVKLKAHLKSETLNYFYFDLNVINIDLTH